MKTTNFGRVLAALVVAALAIPLDSAQLAFPSGVFGREDSLSHEAHKLGIRIVR